MAIGDTHIDHIISACAKWLEEHEAPFEVLGVLRRLHPGSLSKNVRRVRRKCIQAYRAAHDEFSLKNDLGRVLKVIKRRKKISARMTHKRHVSDHRETTKIHLILPVESLQKPNTVSPRFRRWTCWVSGQRGSILNPRQSPSPALPRWITFSGGFSFYRRTSRSVCSKRRKRASPGPDVKRLWRPSARGG